MGKEESKKSSVRHCNEDRGARDSTVGAVWNTHDNDNGNAGASNEDSTPRTLGEEKAKRAARGSGVDDVGIASPPTSSVPGEKALRRAANSSRVSYRDKLADLVGISSREGAAAICGLRRSTDSNASEAALGSTPNSTRASYRGKLVSLGVNPRSMNVEEEYVISPAEETEEDETSAQELPGEGPQSELRSDRLGVSQLATAIPVEDGEMNVCLDIAMAAEYDEEKAAAEAEAQRRKAATKIACALFVLLVLVMGIVLAAIFISLNNKEDKVLIVNITTTSPTPVPTSHADYVLNLLPDYTIWALQNTESAQYQAYQWLLHDEGLGNYSDTRLLQRFALATLFYSTRGTRWFDKVRAGWMSHDTHECSWGFNTNGTHQHIIWDDKDVHYYEMGNSPCVLSADSSLENEELVYRYLWLPVTGLTGELPEELYLLTSLRYLALMGNDLEGTISSRIGMLRDLQALSLAANSHITGTIPPEIGECTSLEALVLENSMITGNIPASVGSLANLKFLYLVELRLSGSIPSELGMLNDLFYVNLMFNGAINGTIPQELANCSSLDTLSLAGNQLSGTLPEWFDQMSALAVLTLSDNQLTGTIPSQIGKLSSIFALHLRSNNFHGEIPTELGNLLNMEDFSLRENRLSGNIPSEFGQWQHAWRFWLQDNKLKGTIPLELTNLAHMETLQLQNNSLTGTLHSEFGALPLLVSLFLHDNKLNGTIPAELGNLDHLEQLILSNNDFTGSIPAPLGQLPTFYVLDVLGNDGLVGEVPSGLCGMEELLFDCSASLCGCTCPCPGKSNRNNGSVANQTRI